MWPYHALKVQWARWRIRHEFTKHRPDEHPGLRVWAPRELITLKGVQYRVAGRYTDPEPALILEPVGYSRNTMMNRLRTLRREDRIEKKALKDLRRKAERRALEFRHVD
jgi:hypothetical protein